MLFALALAVASPSPAACDATAGATISAIDVVGLSRESRDEVTSALSVAPGATLVATDYVRLEDAVLATGAFETASVVVVPAGGGCTLRVTVVERPLVDSVSFTGVTAYAPDVLTALMATKVGAPASSKTADADAARIAQRYQDDGYDAARVTGVDLEGGRVVFHVAEGRIARIAVVGARITGNWRVRHVMGLGAGDLYNRASILRAQAALYRTGLFGSVGFGVEPAKQLDAPDQLVLTVTVSEIRRPWSSTDLLADRGFSALHVAARLRNVGAGHSMRGEVSLEGPQPGLLAQQGFDVYYVAHARAELDLFRPDPATSSGGHLAFDVESIHGRERAELDRRFDLDTPALEAGADVPAFAGDSVASHGSFVAIAGWRRLTVTDLGAMPGDQGGSSHGVFGRGEIGFTLDALSGLESPAGVRLRAGTEMNEGLHPFTYLLADGRDRIVVAPWLALETRGDAGTLAGDVPWWRETAIGGPLGPSGFGRDIGFGRTWGRARADALGFLGETRVPAALAIGWDGAAWAGAEGAHGTRGAQSLFAEARIGPEFAQARAGVAAPLPGATTRLPWCFVGLTLASPY